jgi:hypothetical protein
MRRLTLAICATLAVAGLCAASEPQPVKKTAARKYQAPAGVTMISHLNFVKLTPKNPALSVPPDKRLPFTCSLEQPWTNPDGTPNPMLMVQFVYKGSSPVQTSSLRIYYDLQTCCNATVGAPNSNYLLYPSQGWLTNAGLPPNMNMPPYGQPPLGCTAWGWTE